MAESLLCLDPSSTACGVAYFPTMSPKQAPTFLRRITPKSSWNPIMRIDYILQGVIIHVTEYKPSAVVLEYSSGKVAGRLKSRSPSGLAVLGQAQGEVRMALLDYQKANGSPTVETVDESWTGGEPKPSRAARVALEFQVYRDFVRDHGDGGKDGLDVADAIGIGLYWIAKTNLERMAKDAGT
jgi:Holliday junction resolvasome RuvABC endonuclease subunit